MSGSPPVFAESAVSSNIIRPINHTAPAFKKDCDLPVFVRFLFG